MEGTGLLQVTGAVRAGNRTTLFQEVTNPVPLPHYNIRTITGSTLLFCSIYAKMCQFDLLRIKDL